MTHIEKKIERDYLFGCIKYKGKYEIYLMPVAYWILNSLKYDPTYNPKEWEFVFRGNVLNVTDDNVADFVKAVAVDKIDLNIDVPHLQVLSKEHVQFYFFIDLDEKLLVSSFPEIEVEDYLPDNWTGISDNPLRFVPKNIKDIFAGSVGCSE
jgi:hypothetical protein